MVTRGEYRFSSLMKFKKKEKIYAVFYIAGERFFLFIYDVIVKQKIIKRPANHYYSVV
jgi:hypothetical protein